MKVAWVVRPAAGGILRHLNYLLTGLNKDYQITIFGPQSLQNRFENHPFVPVEFNDGIHPLQDVKAIWRLSRLLAKEKPQLLHMHGLKSIMIATPAARLVGCKTLLFTAHNNLPMPDSHWYKISRGWINRYLLNSQQRIVCVSEAMRGQLVKLVPEHRVVTIYNGVSFLEFPGGVAYDLARETMGVSREFTVVGTVARLIREKGLYTLLEAASILKNILPKLKFVIVGDGPERAQLESFRDALNLKSHVIFLGYQDNVPLLMAGWDVFVLPSFSEGLSVSVLEAMASRLPVVVSDLPSMRELIIQGKGGLLTRPQDSPGLAAAILNILKDREKAKIMGDYNYQRVRQVFSVENMVERTGHLYKDLIAKEYHW